MLGKDARPRSELPPRLLILGGGAVTKELYAPAISLLDWWPSVSILESSDRVAKGFSATLPQANVIRDDFRALLKSPNVKSRFDGVVIALPNHLHEESIALALSASLPILCEKPLALDSASCKLLGQTARDCHTPLSVAMVRRLIPWVGVVREWIRSGMIGDLQSIKIVHGSAFHWPVQSNVYFSKEHGGLLLNMGVHYLDMLQDWVGPLAAVDYQDDFAGGVEANFDFKLKSTTGADVQLKLSVTSNLDNSVEIVGSRGKLTADPGRFDSCFWLPADVQVAAELKSIKPFRSGNWPTEFVSCFAEQLAEFRDVINGVASPRVDADAAAASQELIETAYRRRTRLKSSFSRPNQVRPQLQPGHVVLTGGTGFIGGKLAERLTELQIPSISTVTRSVMTSANVSRFPVQRVFADIGDPDAIRAAMKGARYAFHLAYGTSGAKAFQTTVDGTRNVVEAAIAAEVECLVVVSTASVFGNPPGKVIDETFPYRPALGEYGKSKALAEQFALARAQTSGKTRIVVLNPTAVYGPHAHLFVEFPARKFKNNEFSWIEHGRGKLNFVHVDNLVDAMLLAAQTSAAHGQRFIVNDGVTSFRIFLTRLLGSRADTMASYTRDELVALEKRHRPRMRELLSAMTDDEIMRILNNFSIFAIPKRFLTGRLPSLYGRLQSSRAAYRASPLGPQTPQASAPPSWVADIFAPFEHEFSSARAQSVLGWRSNVSLEDGLAQCVDWLDYLSLAPTTGPNDKK